MFCTGGLEQISDESIEKPPWIYNVAIIICRGFLGIPIVDCYCAEVV